MWIDKKILRIFWVDRITNEKVLSTMNSQLKLIQTIKQQKLEYLGHIMRNLSNTACCNWDQREEEYPGSPTYGQKVQIAMMIANI